MQQAESNRFSTIQIQNRVTELESVILLVLELRSVNCSNKIIRGTFLEIQIPKFQRFWFRGYRVRSQKTFCKFPRWLWCIASQVWDTVKWQSVKLWTGINVGPCTTRESPVTEEGRQRKSNTRVYVLLEKLEESGVCESAWENDWKLSSWVVQGQGLCDLPQTPIHVSAISLIQRSSIDKKTILIFHKMFSYLHR